MKKGCLELNVISDICGKTFKNSYGLCGHVRLLHSKDLKVEFTCDICDFELTRFHLKDHVENVHNICYKEFRLKDSLLKHMGYEHNESKITSEI